MSTTSSFISEPLAIESLIVDRSRVLDLSRPDLMRRAGYKNIAKGLRRLDELLAGDLNKTGGLIRALPAALDVPPEVVEHAIEETRRRIAEAQEAARQAREAASRYSAFLSASFVSSSEGGAWRFTLSAALANVKLGTNNAINHSTRMEAPSPKAHFRTSMPGVTLPCQIFRLFLPIAPPHRSLPA